ncbi:MAG: hypothetical protein JXX28_00270 [Deltaproteobacteria bacterium]|nr:hypothetical protein [Deltaproteobacteria bacterium]
MPGRGAVAVALAGAGGGTCPEALRDPLDPIDLPAEERLWAGDAWELALAERALLSARLERLGRAGVRLLDPSRVYLEPSVVVEPGAFLGAGVELRGATVVRAGARVEAGCVLTDTTVEGGAVVLPYSVCEGAAIGAGAKVGPMAHLRTGAVLEARVKVGNFVEVKKSVLREGAKASHLTYIGDAEIGADANIGAGTITCNYDGFNKHRTVIGAGAFIGSNSSLVAPIEIGAGAIVGAGSTLSRQVPEDALAVERAEQRVLPDKARAIREKNRRLKEGGGA